jgi:hypothetical protein
MSGVLYQLFVNPAQCDKSSADKGIRESIRIRKRLTLAGERVNGFLMTDPIDEPTAMAALLARASQTPAGKTFCPSDAARDLAGSDPDSWGRAMVPIRKAAVRLATEGRLVILRKGRPVDPLAFKGVYRLAQPRLD